MSVIFGNIQTALYLGFGWIYWTRQRVKLYNGGVVDADNLDCGWLLSRIFGKSVVGDERGTDDEESVPALDGRDRGGARGSSSRVKWGARGIFVSSDDDVLDHTRSLDDDEEEAYGVTAAVDLDAKV